MCVLHVQRVQKLRDVTFRRRLHWPDDYTELHTLGCLYTLGQTECPNWKVHWMWSGVKAILFNPAPMGKTCIFFHLKGRTWCVHRWSCAVGHFLLGHWYVVMCGSTQLNCRRKLCAATWETPQLVRRYGTSLRRHLLCPWVCCGAKRDCWLGQKVRTSILESS